MYRNHTYFCASNARLQQSIVHTEPRPRVFVMVLLSTEYLVGIKTMDRL